ncbi:putative O-glycosylation ligase, exosortase A system-associated [Novosphingopyxis baekryungensis]|uniref:putative O-glycosylation ligase, exosortase A system-associated n=1 Tax=Novosphingopyxis baekryungensis TaxID=279369 RepID=UPI0003B60F01|nr:putative O-glycosylation ligase, exosortase A system-associated [Novosphingopyxis baekryungensis]
MRDLYLLGFLGLFLLFGLRKPFLFTLTYAYIDIVAPQRLSYYLLNSIPISLIVFALALFGFLLDRNKIDARVSGRQICMLVLLAYAGYTTITADVPVEAASKWDWVWKALVFAIFLPLTLRTKLRIEALALTMVLSLAALVVNGGLKTLLSGGGYGALVILVDDNSGLYEGSIISCVSIAVIPLVWWLANHGTIFPARDERWRLPLKLFAIGLTGAAILVPIGTQARTGLVCLVVLFILSLRFSRYKMLYAFGAMFLALAAIPFLPSAFSERMGTIQNYEEDESASTRLAVWGWTLDYVKSHPGGGGFEAYRQNTLRYEMPAVDSNGIATGGTEVQEVVDAGRAYHSSYFEMLGEQGFFGLLLWLIIHVGGVWRMELLRRRYKDSQKADQQWITPLAQALQNAQIVYLTGSLFVGIAFQPFVYMLIAMQIGLDTYLARRRKEEGFVSIAAQLKAKAG